MLWILSRGLDPEYVLKRLLAASLLLLFAIVYLFELRPQLLTVNPENLLTLFAEDKSHVYLYMSAWGNLPTAVLGLLLASTYRRLQRENTDLTQNKIFVDIHRVSLLLLLLWISMPFFFTNIESHLAVALYATAEKSVFAAVLSVTSLGCFYKVEGPATSVLCWPGWRVLSRLSLSSLMIHVAVIGQITFSRIHNSTSHTQMLADTAAVSVISYLLALPLTLLIEYPAARLYKAVVDTSSKEETENHTSVKSKQS
ncbi:hypothetical protein EVAR_70950_1 [Eumeta japonica]|uniref:Nose resistant to fluoxetine protein 6 n=1 Tax=Eumeta variegata TaxID=151549 RepID=A0A4C1ZVP7_EUMVA|nr:hypothetical protein EVAR_70950_1 [Eumeta japonica]